VCEANGFYIRIPIGRVDDSGELGVAGQAFRDAMTDLPRAQLRAVVSELLSLEAFRLELDALLLDLEEGGV
jgi:hypothetical protein